MRSVIVAMVLLAAGQLHAGSDEDLRRLADPNGEVLSVGHNARVEFVRYCPDNTCIELEAPASAPAPALSDFAVAYLYFAGSYVHLRDFVASGAALTAHAVVTAYARDCPAGSDLVVASCALMLIARDHQIRATWVTFDEGVETRTPVDLSHELSPDNLLSVQKWRIEQWHRP